MRYSIGIECGQRLLRARSWRRPLWRSWNTDFSRGCAFGPIMVWKR